MRSSPLPSLLLAPARARSPSTPHHVHPVPVRPRHLPYTHFPTPSGLGRYVSEGLFASLKAFRGAPSRPVGKKVEGQGIQESGNDNQITRAKACGLLGLSPTAGCAQALREEGRAGVGQWERKLGPRCALNSARATCCGRRRKDARAVRAGLGFQGWGSAITIGRNLSVGPVGRRRWERRALRRAPVRRAGAPVRMRLCTGSRERRSFLLVWGGRWSRSEGSRAADAGWNCKHGGRASSGAFGRRSAEKGVRGVSLLSLLRSTW